MASKKWLLFKKLLRNFRVRLLFLSAFTSPLWLLVYISQTLACRSTLRFASRFRLLLLHLLLVERGELSSSLQLDASKKLGACLYGICLSAWCVYLYVGRIRDLFAIGCAHYCYDSYNALARKCCFRLFNKAFALQKAA